MCIFIAFGKGVSQLNIQFYLYMFFVYTYFCIYQEKLSIYAKSFFFVIVQLCSSFFLILPKKIISLYYLCTLENHLILLVTLSLDFSFDEINF